MSKKSMISRARLAMLLFAVVLSSGCENPCYIPPLVSRLATVRVVNSMVDQPSIIVTMDGSPIFGYRNQKVFNYKIEAVYSDSLANGDYIIGGVHRIKVTPSTDTNDVLIDTLLSFSPRRQTLVLMGRGHTKSPGDPRSSKAMLLIDDAMQASADNSFARYINAIPDIDSTGRGFKALDVYFASEAKGEKITLQYGEYFGYDTIIFANGLTVTESGHPENIVVSLSIPFEAKGFLSTIILRGESKPLGIEPIAAPLLLSDREVGNVNYELPPFGVRVVNAMRESPITLSLRGDADKGPRGLISGIELKLTPPGGVSRYWPLSIAYHGGASTKYFFSTPVDISRDTLVDSSSYASEANHRYTLLPIEKNTLGNVGARIDTLRMEDTMRSPGSGFGRVRFVNASIDNPNLSFSWAGKNITLGFKQVAFHDGPTGPQVFNVAGKSVEFTLATGHPVTIFFLPARAGEPIRYTVVTD